MRRSSSASGAASAQAEELRPGQDSLFLGLALHEDDGPQPGQAGASGEEPVEVAGVLDDGDRRLRVGGDVLALLGGGGGIDAGREPPGGDRGLVRDEPFRTVEAHDHDPGPRLHAEAHEGPGGAPNLVPVLAPGGGPPGALALAGHGRAVRVGARGRFEDLEDGVGHDTVSSDGPALGRGHVRRQETGLSRRTPGIYCRPLCRRTPHAALRRPLRPRDDPRGRADRDRGQRGAGRPRPAERGRPHRRREAPAGRGRGRARQPDRRGGLDRRRGGLRGPEDARPRPRAAAPSSPASTTRTRTCSGSASRGSTWTSWARAPTRRSSTRVAQAVKRRAARRVGPRPRLARGQVERGPRRAPCAASPPTRRSPPSPPTTRSCSSGPTVTPSSPTRRRWP